MQLVTSATETLQFQIGQRVIANEYDKPCAKLICKIQNIKETKDGFELSLNYISEEMKKEYPLDKPFLVTVKTLKRADSDYPKLIEDYGVDYIEKDDSKFIIKRKQSTCSWEGFVSQEELNLRRFINDPICESRTSIEHGAIRSDLSIDKANHLSLV